MGILFLLFTAFFWIAVIGGGFYVAIRALRALEQRGSLPPRADPQALGRRVARLEETLEQMSGELERLAEGQEFTQRLLGERHGAGSGNREAGSGDRPAPSSAPSPLDAPDP